MPLLIHKQQMVGITPDIESIGNVNINNPQAGECLIYDEVNQEWINGTVGGSSGSDGDYISLYGRTDISSRSDLKIRRIGNYYYNGIVSTKFSDIPADIITSGYNALWLVVKTLANNTPYSCIQYLTLFSAADQAINQYTRYCNENPLTTEVVWGDWHKCLDDTNINIVNPASGQIVSYVNNKWQNTYLSGAKYDSSNTLADIIGDVETLLAAL